MDPDELTSMVQERVESAVAITSEKLLSDLDALISTRFSTMQTALTQSQSAISVSQLDAIKSIKITQQPELKKKGNRAQHTFNSKVQDLMESAKSDLESPITQQTLAHAHESLNKDTELIKERQKLIRLADQIETGWAMVEEYETNELADNSDDEKRILRAESRAAKKMKETRVKKSRRNVRTDVNSRTAYSLPGPSSFRRAQQTVSARGTPSSLRSGSCFGCGKPGHYRFECGAVSAVQSKISTDSITVNSSVLSEQSSIMLYPDCLFQPSNSANPVSSDYNKVSEIKVVNESSESPVGRLGTAYVKWEDSGANTHVLDIFKNEYKLPLFEIPPVSFCTNNKSALDNADFVTNEIEKLLAKCCISRMREPPTVVNPLTVACNRVGKLRLVLDCRIINLFLFKFGFKLDDIEIAKQLFKQGDYLFTFDLKSAYHYIEIYPEHRAFLGFSWNREMYVFNVLPFRISTAAYIFTKIVRVMVAYWRSHAFRVAMYMDDGCGGASTLADAQVLSNETQRSITEFGFLIAPEKCHWVPSNTVIWLGHVLDMTSGIISVTEDRINSLLESITKVIGLIVSGAICIKVRKLASLVGKIISMHTAMGPTVQFKIRYLYNCIESRTNWKGCVKVSSEVLEELLFWQGNAIHLNGKAMYQAVVPALNAYSDASAIGYGGYVVEDGKSDVTGLWSVDEQTRSSTWRELEAVSRVLNETASCVSHQVVNWHTDNQNVARILKVGSSSSHLQEVALRIYDSCQQVGIKIQPVWIPRGLNARADALSKGGDCDDWAITEEAFVFVDSVFGPHTIDRFACGYNCKLVRFNSRWHFQNAEAVDALAQPWKGENNWLVPPPRLVVPSLRKLKAESCCGTFVVPEWRSAPFWPHFCIEHNTFRKFVKGVIVLDANLSGVKGRGFDLSGRIGSMLSTDNSELLRLSQMLPEVLLGSRSENTNKKYWAYFNKWQRFIQENGRFHALPGNHVHVALYITSLMENKCSFSVISASFYAIKWAHNLVGEPDPTAHPFVVNVLERAKRSCSRPIVRKDPVSANALRELCTKYRDSNDLVIVRDLLMMLLGFSGFSIKCEPLLENSEPRMVAVA